MNIRPLSIGLYAVLLLAAGIGVGWGIAVRHDVAAHATPPSASHAGPHADSTAVSASAAAAPAERKVLYWYDPMVPTQKFDHPGKSPFMDMELVPRYADEAGAGAGMGAGLAVSTQAQQALGLRLATVESRRLASQVEAVGNVQLSERDIAVVQARTAGFVERVYARAPGDVVAAGAPLVDLLNPEWLGAQREYLAVKAAGDAGLAQAARQRLALLGMPPALVDRVDRAGQPVAVQTVTAPIGGLVTELAVRAGMTVAPGMTLVRINGLSTVWLEAALPEAQADFVRPGLAVQARFAALGGQPVAGKVGAILSEANRDTRTLRVRIELPNPGLRLRAGMSAQVTLSGAAREVLVLPAEAVIRTGRRALVYLAQPAGRYEPLEIEAGEQIGEQIVVRDGLVAGQRVVASGQFLLDSEASLQGVMARGAAGDAAKSGAAVPASGATR